MRTGVSSVVDKHELADHPPLAQQLVRLSCSRKRKLLRDQRFDLVLLKEIEQNNQVLSKPCRSSPFEPLNTIGNHPSTAGKKPPGGNVQPEDGNLTETVTTT
jgi:hypothetical protein